MEVCEVCGVLVSTSTAKGIKQHLRSKPHKDALRHGRKEVEKKVAVSCQLHGFEDAGMNELPVVHPRELEPVESSFLDPDGFVVCLPPRLVQNPKKHMSSGYPFLTLKALPHSREDRVIDLDIGQVVETCCCAGGRRLPNVDINGENICVKSHPEALTLLRSAIDEKRPFWASVQADSEVAHPEWWPADRMVPTYTNILITQGETCGIGMHIDVDHYANSGPVIDTYLTIIKGSKQVLMFPPNGSKEHEQIGSSSLPKLLTKDQLERIVEGNGYFFTLSADPRPRTLFIPRAWHHWLVSTSSESIAFTSSVYRRSPDSAV
ncbi:hypothetical protein NDN08_002494 [Rhodosorus marinus]|uniref:JmjC domain-containing protein n=1 Tax=Rhodosorus marinus TaxID=101924 RepID=A0AAV8UVC1_9RHOD|nr:hypothetical protein NDN08_002494 [Rhodosorus marinus]